MATQDKLNKVLAIIRTIMDDDEQLSKVLKFLEDEILEEEPFRSFHKNDDHLKDVPLLSQAIYGKKPFADFNHQIYQSDYRQDWFDFRQMEAEKYIIKNYFYDINELTKK